MTERSDIEPNNRQRTLQLIYGFNGLRNQTLRPTHFPCQECAVGDTTFPSMFNGI